MTELIMGIDIGTSKIAAGLIDPFKNKIINIEKADNPYLTVKESWKKEQDPYNIEKTIIKILKKIVKPDMNILSVGITGQMHGILGIDNNGNPKTNFVTWEDNRGNVIQENGKTLLNEITEKLKSETTGVSSGFGVVTLYSWLKRNIQIHKVVNIADYIGMKMTGTTSPLIDYTMAESFGCFDIKNKIWDQEILDKLNIDINLLPDPVPSNRIIGIAEGKDFKGIFKSPPEVCVSIGDNQASFLGSVKRHFDTILINIGTGSQISIAERDYTTAISYPFIDGKDVQVRPFVESSYIVAGNALSGGSAYKTVHNFLKEIGENIFKIKVKNDIYREMEELALKGLELLANSNSDNNRLQVYPLFSGKRSNPELRGWIKNINTDNFKPSLLIVETMFGMINILTEMFTDKIIKSKKHLVGSGNGIKKNIALQRIIQNHFGKSINICKYDEEAVMGAAINGAVACGVFDNYEKATSLIEYK